MTDVLLSQLLLRSIIFAICIIIEIITMGLTTIWFSGGALIAAISVFFHATIFVQVFLFAVVSLILLFTTRPIAKKHFNSENMEKTNVESLVGQHVLVTGTIDNIKSTGQVKVNGLEWTARAVNDDIIPEGTVVEVVEVSGVKLIVSRI
jgi:membrane protein implicated in regulation of membrane protease activity